MKRSLLLLALGLSTLAGATNLRLYPTFGEVRQPLTLLQVTVERGGEVPSEEKASLTFTLKLSAG